MGSNVTQIEGYMARGGDTPWINPHAIKIVGVDVDKSATNWFAYCPRVDKPLEKEWVDDIRQNGVRVAADVCRDGNNVLALDARRRILAARVIWDEQKEAGVPEEGRIAVRISIHKGVPEAYYAINVGSQNRKDLTYVERAQLMSEAKVFGISDEKLAKMYGCTVQSVRQTLTLLDLDASVQSAVEEGTLPFREAIKMVSLPRAEQKQLFEKLLAEGATKGAAAANGISRHKRGDLTASPIDRTRMRSRVFLERLAGTLAGKDDYETLYGFLRFVLGGPLPEIDSKLGELFAEAGWKDKTAPKVKVKKEKKVREPRAKKTHEPKAKKTREPKAKKAKKVKPAIKGKRMKTTRTHAVA